MQNRVRYNVVNQDGRPVIRAVPVAPRTVIAAAQAAARPSREQTFSSQDLARTIRAGADESR